MQTKTFNAQAGQVLKQTHILRSRMEKVRARMKIHLTNVQREIDDLDAALKVEYTGHVALLKRTATGWECLRCVDSNHMPDDAPEDFDLALPIPTPESLPDFEGW